MFFHQGNILHNPSESVKNKRTFSLKVWRHFLKKLTKDLGSFRGMESYLLLMVQTEVDDFSSNVTTNVLPPRSRNTLGSGFLSRPLHNQWALQSHLETWSWDWSGRNAAAATRLQVRY